MLGRWKTYQEQDYWQKYSVDDLVACLQDRSTALEVRHSAYLALITTGSLRHLQQFAADMDFTYQDARGDALTIAAVSSKHEVMRWLKKNIPIYKDVSAADQSRLVFLLINQFNAESLAVLTGQQDTDGFGWSLDVYDENGKSPAVVAAQHGPNYFLRKLVTKREDGGFGLQLDQAVVDEMNKSNKLSLQHRPGMVYHRKTLQRQVSFIDLNGELFFPQPYFSVSAFVIGRLFASKRDPANVLLVKQLNPQLGRPATNEEICHCMAEANNEIHLRQQANPEDEPHSVFHYLDETEGYNFRAISRIPKGESLDKLLMASSSVAKTAVLLLSAVRELNRLHVARFVNGNAKVANMFMEQRNEKKYGENIFIARLVQYYQGNRTGGIITMHGVHEGYAPELRNQSQTRFAKPEQDIFRFAFSLKACIESDAKNRPDFYEGLHHHFPEVYQFYKSGVEVDPAKRPTLSLFIQELQAKLITYEKQMQAQPTNSFAASATSFFRNNAGALTFTAAVGAATMAAWRLHNTRKL